MDEFSKTNGQLIHLGVLAFDEMDIKRSIDYSHSFDQVFDPNKKAQVGMLRGLCNSWKMPA
uniref:Uncharacterized protein n=1 Tax=Lepeophtheirus salmonis TaxID=72036 RepID=A0A0K2TJ39_LEPSM